MTEALKSRRPAKSDVGDFKVGKRRAARQSTVKSDETRRSIISAAIRCFHRDGYFRTNISSVAKEAGVTRGCLQYYFETTETLLRAAAVHVVETIWKEFETLVKNIPEGVNPLEHQLDLSFMASKRGHFPILIELMAASRTEPMLRDIIRESMEKFDELRIALTGEIFDDPSSGLKSNYRAASDFVVIVAAGLAVYKLPGEDPQRADDVRAAAKEQTYRLWGMANPNDPS